MAGKVTEAVVVALREASGEREGEAEMEALRDTAAEREGEADVDLLRLVVTVTEREREAVAVTLQAPKTVRRVRGGAAAKTSSPFCAALTLQPPPAAVLLR